MNKRLLDARRSFFRLSTSILTDYRSISLLTKLLIAVFIFIAITSTSGNAGRQTASQIKFEGELKSIKDAGFTYDDLTFSSGDPDADKRIKEVVDFVNSDPGVQVFTITIKFAFLNDERITDKSYKGNAFYILGKTPDGLQIGHIYLTKRVVNRAMATHKDLLYVLALHECGHVWQHWAIIRNGADQDDPEIRQKFDVKTEETGADGWAGRYTDLFFKKKYSTSAESAKNSLDRIVIEYFGGDYFVFDKTKVTDVERKTAFLRAYNAKPMPYGPPRPPQ